MAEYVPLPLSVTGDPIDPWPVPSDAKVTVAPPAVRLFPFASFSCTVNVLCDVPSAVRLAGLAVTVLVAADAAPGTYVIVIAV